MKRGRHAPAPAAARAAATARALSPVSYVFASGNSEAARQALEAQPAPPTSLLCLPDAAKAIVVQYVPSLVTSMLLIKERAITARIARLQREEERLRRWRTHVHGAAVDGCPHDATWVESDGDYHRPGYCRYCRLCHEQVSLRPRKAASHS